MQSLLFNRSIDSEFRERIQKILNIVCIQRGHDSFMPAVVDGLRMRKRGIVRLYTVYTNGRMIRGINEASSIQNWIDTIFEIGNNHTRK